MEKRDLYKAVKLETIRVGKTVEDKCLEEMRELSAELLVSYSDVKTHHPIENYLELADEIADLIITLEQVSEKEFFDLVKDRFRFKLCRLESRLENGGLFK